MLDFVVSYIFVDDNFLFQQSLLVTIHSPKSAEYFNVFWIL